MLSRLGGASKRGDLGPFGRGPYRGTVRPSRLDILPAAAFGTRCDGHGRRPAAEADTVGEGAPGKRPAPSARSRDASRPPAAPACTLTRPRDNRANDVADRSPSGGPGGRSVSPEAERQARPGPARGRPRPRTATRKPPIARGSSSRPTAERTASQSSIVVVGSDSDRVEELIQAERRRGTPPGWSGRASVRPCSTRRPVDGAEVDVGGQVLAADRDRTSRRGRAGPRRPAGSRRRGSGRTARPPGGRSR